MLKIKGLVPALVVVLGVAVYAISPVSHQLFCSGPAVVSGPEFLVP